MKDLFFYDRFGKPHQKPGNMEIKKRISVDAVIIKNGKILLVKEKDLNLWEMPGGGIEKGETLEEALKREVHEETGYEVLSILENLGSEHQYFYAENKDVYYDSTVNFFKIEVGDYQDIKSINRKETQGVEWFDLEKLDFNLIKPFHYDLIERFKK